MKIFKKIKKEKLKNKDMLKLYREYEKILKLKYINSNSKKTADGENE
jgi:hypothetical protein